MSYRGRGHKRAKKVSRIICMALMKSKALINYAISAPTADDDDNSVFFAF